MSNNVIPLGDPPVTDLVANSQEAGQLPLRMSYYGTLTSTFPEGDTITYEILDAPAGTLLDDEQEYGNDVVLPNFIYVPPEDPGYGSDQFTFRIYDAELDAYSDPAIVHLRVDTTNPMPEGRIGSRVKTDSGIAQIDVYSTKNYHSDPVAAYVNEEVLGTIQADPFCDIWADDGQSGFTDVWRYLVRFDDDTEGWVAADSVLPVAIPTNQLVNGVGVLISGGDGSEQFFTINATEQIYNLVVTISGNNGDADLYMRFGAPPVPTALDQSGGVYDYRPFENGSNERISVATPALGTYHVLVHGWHDEGGFTNVTLRATWSTTPVVVLPPPGDDTPDTAVPIQLTSITKNGIEWTFSESKLCGQYCNGDWWVVGPVTINAINPPCFIREDVLTSGGVFPRTVNGTLTNMTVNPTYGDPYVQQSWDNAVSLDGKANEYGTYSGSRNVAPSKTGEPLVCPANTTVVSSISTSSLPKNSSYSQIERLVMLTVVSEAPSIGAFRPAPFDADKTSNWNESQLNYSIFQKLEPVASVPSLSSVENDFAESWVTFHTGNAIQSMSPNSQMPRYGREISWGIADALFALNLNYTDAQKRRLYIALVQYGIDIYGFLTNGGFYRGAGGLNQGHKAPLVLAAVTFGHVGMAEWASPSKYVTYKPPSTKLVRPFAEDSQVFIVDEGDVGKAVIDQSSIGRPRVTYGPEHVGLPEWGIEHEFNHLYDASNWTAIYRDINGTSFVPHSLAIRMIAGAESVWDNPIFFDYCDRYWAREGALPFTNQSFSANKIIQYHWDMLKAYHSQFA